MHKSTFTATTPIPVGSYTPDPRPNSAWENVPDLLARGKNSEFPFKSYHSPYVPHAPYRNVHNPVSKRVW